MSEWRKFLPLLSLRSAHLYKCLSPGQSQQLSERSSHQLTHSLRQGRDVRTKNQRLKVLTSGLPASKEIVIQANTEEI